jgi:hypothetical protein
MTIGGILGESWRLYTKFFTRFFALAAIVYLVVNLVNGIVGEAIGTSGGVRVVLELVSVIVTLIGTYWLQGALVYAVSDVRDGKIDTTITGVFERVESKVLPLIGAGILAGIGIGIGFILLVVPGLILLTWWSLIVPVIVLENRPVMASFGRSRELVRGHAWTVFGIVVITAILSAVAALLIEAIFSFLGSFLRIWIGGTIASAIVGPFFAVALTLVFFRLLELESPPAPASAAADGSPDPA